MYARQNPDGTLAFFVENYLIQAGADYAYSPLNLDAAIVRDTRWLVGINAIEFSPGPNGGAPFREVLQLHSRRPACAGSRWISTAAGVKAMPGPCISCHGGRGDALTPPDATGKPLFNLVQNGVSLHARRRAGAPAPVRARRLRFLHHAPGILAPEQEAAIKTINKWILCSYPIADALDGARGRVPPRVGRERMAGHRGGADQGRLWRRRHCPPPRSTTLTCRSRWLAAGQQTLYREVVAPSCRTCHVMRGTGGAIRPRLQQSTRSSVGYADRIKAHVIDRGNMPLAKIVFDAFCGDRRRARRCWRPSSKRRATRCAIPRAQSCRPGRPIADPGPDRVTPPGATVLSASGSLFASGYAWTLVSGPAGATLDRSHVGAGHVQCDRGGNLRGAARREQRLDAERARAGDRRGRSRRSRRRRRRSASPTSRRSAEPDDRVRVVPQPRRGRSRDPPVLYSNEDRNGDGTVGDATDDALVPRRGAQPDQFHRPRREPAAAQALGQPPQGRGIAGFDTDAPPGDRRARTTTCSSTGS